MLKRKRIEDNVPPYLPPDEVQETLDMRNFNDLEDVIKECFLIFEGTSKYNTPYKVLVVKKKYSFDPALITLFSRIGVVTLKNPSSPG